MKKQVKTIFIQPAVFPGCRLLFMVLWLVLQAGVLFARPADPLDSLSTNTVLYEVTHPGTQKVSYLFGTHHAFGSSFFNGLQNATDALLASDILIKENLNIPGHLAEDIINGRTKITKWSKYLSREDLAFVQDIFSSSAVNIGKMTPTELYAFLTRYYKKSICLGEDPSDGYFSLDDYIGSVAETHQLQLVGLETTEAQIELINKDVQGMPRKVHKKRLAGLMKRIRSGRNDHCAEIDWYRNMDFDFKFGQACQNTLLLTDRNNAWMDQLEGHLQQNDCFIAVGLSHLMFECGLIRQLSRLGYTIVPVALKQ